MALEQTWRWFGPGDPISLQEIRQTGATGIVTALHHIPVGEIWPADEIMARKGMIESAGFTWSVAESLPVHEDIKKRTGEYRKYIENYKVSLRNLASCGMTTVCYNFMPVLDWSRTDIRVRVTDGSITTKFESRAFAAFDVFLLKRPGADADYTPEKLLEARRYFGQLTEAQQKQLIETVLLGLPGSMEAYTLDGLRAALQEYREIGQEELQLHLNKFLDAIIPVAEESGVFMAIHPDDPPRPLLGLPRVVSDASDLDRILRVVDTPVNGITLCTGSLGAGIQNDVPKLTEQFARRVNFVHLRNVSRTAEGDFLEEDHLAGDVDMFTVMRTLLVEQKVRRETGRQDVRLPMRPDHGHLMIPDEQRKGIYPGYSLFGRMRGLAELRGLELGIRNAFVL